ncbi:hypothetical protein [Sanguibacter gelidistatuariae]|uniref:hypothetical protein n=1 Tax=Sanguibacter gelidistatuariae TaxID=1814289 RepID=UPI000B88ACA4|nr:hypothetical protein [Sanguibacter gelidistatuariae]
MTKMTTAFGVTGPDPVAGPVFAVPASAPIETLARAWYPAARWLREPVTAEAVAARTVPLRGARFRGMSTVAEPEPGELELEDGVVLTGPSPLPPDRYQGLGLTAQRVDVFGVRIDGADAASRAEREVRVLRWMVAAARHARGAVVVEGADTAIPLDPRRSVNRHLFSALTLDPGHALALVRTVLVQATLETVGPDPSAPQNFEIVTHTPYDGSVVVRCERAGSLPPALRTIPWRESGPFGYSVRWLSGDAHQERSESPSHMYQIARHRMAPVVVDVVSVLRDAVAGTVLDDDGFICTDPPVRSR